MTTKLYFLCKDLVLFSSRCLNNWRRSSQTWRSLPANTNRKSEKAHSSGFSFRKCAPPLESTLLPVRNCLNFNSTFEEWTLYLLTPSFLFLLCSLAGKGFWSEMLGVGDFYYELGVQIIEVCLALKHRNGGVWFHWKLKRNTDEKNTFFATMLLILSHTYNYCSILLLFWF